MFILLNQAAEILSCAAESAPFKKPIKATNSFMNSLRNCVCVSIGFVADTNYLEHTLCAALNGMRCFLMPPIVQMISLFYVLMHAFMYIIARYTCRLPPTHSHSRSCIALITLNSMESSQTLCTTFNFLSRCKQCDLVYFVCLTPQHYCCVISV